MRSFALFFCFCLTVEVCSGQLSDLRYLPPLKQSATIAVADQKIYVTTPSTTSFSVDVYRGTSTSIYSTLTGLSPNTRYYVRAYATNKQGTSYGEEISFTTSN